MSYMPLGTRTKQGFKYERVPQGRNTRFLRRDLHMAKLVTASLTFSTSPARVTGANGTFAATFALNDPVLVGGANLNNGYFTVTGLDGANNAFLALDPPPAAEGPITVTLRTP